MIPCLEVDKLWHLCFYSEFFMFLDKNSEGLLMCSRDVLLFLDFDVEKNPLCHVVVDRKENLLHLNFKLSVSRVFQVSACQRFCGTWTVSGPQTRSPAFNFERTLMRRYLLKVFSWWNCLSKWGVGPFERGNHLSAQGQQCWSGQSHCVSVIIKNWEDSVHNGTHLGCVLQ